MIVGIRSVVLVMPEDCSYIDNGIRTMRVNYKCCTANVGGYIGKNYVFKLSSWGMLKVTWYSYLLDAKEHKVKIELH